MPNEMAQDHEALIQFLYLAPIGLVQTQLDGTILMVNPLCAQLLVPLTPDGALDNLFTALQDLAPDLAHRAASFIGSHGMVCDAVLLPIGARASTNQGPQVLSLSLLKLDNERLMAVLSDVTQSVQRDRALRESQAWVNSMASSITDYALVQLDGSGRIVGSNSSIARLTGFERDSVQSRSMAIFYPAGQLPPQCVLGRLQEADENGWAMDEGWRCRADGSHFWGNCLIAPLHEPDGARPDERAYSLIIRDISDRREANETLRRSVLCDHLTGLANRRAFFDAAEQELCRWRRQPRPLSLVAIDADHFKQINDRHGHAAGDAVLRHLAAGLGAIFRNLDLVARCGGEEFVVLIPGTAVEGALAAAQRLCRAVAAQVVHVDGEPIRYTVSAGVAAMDGDVAGLDALMKRADAALYAAKAQGRNRAQQWHAGLRRGMAQPVST